MPVTSSDGWDPTQYQKFRQERTEPFHDLLQLITPQEKMHIIDLGCGTGELTQALHQTLHAASTLGIDTSPTMLKESRRYLLPHLQFEQKKIEEFSPKEPVDLLFSNAALQWLPDHPALFAKFATFLTQRGQFAFQLPANQDYPTHSLAREMDQWNVFHPATLKPEEYASLLQKLGFRRQTVRLQVYPHVLASTEELLEWVKGSLLTTFQRHLSPSDYSLFLQEYKEKLLAHFGDQHPFFIPFKRLLIWASY